MWLLNSCTVKNPAEDHFKNAIQAAQSANIPVVVTGCVPQGAPKDKFVKGLSTVGVQQIDRVVEVVEETLKGNTVKIMGPKVRLFFIHSFRTNSDFLSQRYENRKFVYRYIVVLARKTAISAI